jgi:hypothetical protein
MNRQVDLRVDAVNNFIEAIVDTSEKLRIVRRCS